MEINTCRQHLQTTPDPMLELQRQVARLQLKVSELEEENASLRKQVTTSQFSLDRFKDDDEVISFYTGFPDYATLNVFYEVCLEDDAQEMRQW